MAGSNLHALILAGGRGTRFWPRSRKRHAKQVLEFLGSGSLIQQTAHRLERILPANRIWILTNHYLRDEIVRQLPGIPRRQILAEPAQRNTAPAIGLACHIIHGMDPEAVLGVFPADHYIERPASFLRLVRAAYKAARSGEIALIGIQPRWAETGYGYVEFPRRGFRTGGLDPLPVVGFREKPDLATARRFLKAGHFAWNAGMFFWPVARFQRELRSHLPATAALLDSLPPFRSPRFARELSRVFPQCDNVSVDYAILEKARGVVGLAAGDIGWNDVGSWHAVYELTPRDTEGNATRSSALFEGSSGNFVDAAGKLVALVGVKNLVVVDTPDALLVCSRDEAQRVSDLVKRLEKLQRDDLL
jgi:mannose-1-phosphate guanylyltransferase